MGFKSDRAFKRHYLKECGQLDLITPQPKKKKKVVVKAKVKRKPKPKYKNNSKGEVKIAAILNSLSVKFVPEKIYKDCKNPKTGFALRFDFYIPSLQLLIEYDGIHHVKKLRGQTDEQFESQKERDAYKNEYCRINGIKLLRIPSSKYRKLDTIIRGLFTPPSQT